MFHAESEIFKILTRIQLCKTKYEFDALVRHVSQLNTQYEPKTLSIPEHAGYILLGGHVAGVMTKTIDEPTAIWMADKIAELYFGYPKDRIGAACTLLTAMSFLSINIVAKSCQRYHVYMKHYDYVYRSIVWDIITIVDNNELSKILPISFRMDKMLLSAQHREPEGNVNYWSVITKQYNAVYRPDNRGVMLALDEDMAMMFVMSVLFGKGDREYNQCVRVWARAYQRMGTLDSIDNIMKNKLSIEVYNKCLGHWRAAGSS